MHWIGDYANPAEAAAILAESGVLDKMADDV
jgi:hypothetical protein